MSRRCPVCRPAIAPNAKRCPPCAYRRKLLRDRKAAADKRARIRQAPRWCRHPGCRVNLRGTRRQRCLEHAKARVAADRQFNRELGALQHEIAAEEEQTPGYPVVGDCEAAVGRLLRRVRRCADCKTELDPGNYTVGRCDECLDLLELEQDELADSYVPEPAQSTRTLVRDGGSGL